MLKDRGMIKWQPFNSVAPTSELINSILEEKKKINKPTLSIDQINKLNDLIIEHYYDKTSITIKYFKNNKIFNVKGIITKLDQTKKIITINKQNIHISQILQINT